jgi:protein ImuB
MKRSSAAKGNVQRPTSNAQRSIADRSVQEILAILHKWGIHTFGQLAALDKDHLAVRLGPEAVRMWERANGQSHRVLKLVRPPESFEESFEFEHEIETAQPLLFMLRRFLEQLAVRLSAIYFVARELTLRIIFLNKQIYEHVFKIPQPTNDIDLLFRMLHTHLENFRSKHPIIAVALSAQPTKPAREQFGLFETTLRNPHQFSETLARLIALLGAERVGTPVLEETHRPDAFRMEPFAWNSIADLNRPSSSPSPRREKASPLSLEGRGEGNQIVGTVFKRTAALRRFRPAVRASVLLDDDRPMHVRSSDFHGEIVRQGGPYLLSGNWWDEKSWARAEWNLQLDDKSLIRCHESEGTWKIDGIYD